MYTIIKVRFIQIIDVVSEVLIWSGNLQEKMWFELNRLQALVC